MQIVFCETLRLNIVKWGTFYELSNVSHSFIYFEVILLYIDFLYVFVIIFNSSYFKGYFIYFVFSI